MPVATKIDGRSEGTNAFEQLVRDLSSVLGPRSGINSEDMDAAKLQELMEQYQSNEKHWLPYAFGDESRPYTRNLVDEGNGKSNLLILVWSPGRGSPVHDHADAHCIMKVLQGSLCETLYEWPDEEKGALTVKKNTVYGRDQVTYMSDQLGLHKVFNPNPDKPAVSLHHQYIHLRTRQNMAAISSTKTREKLDTSTNATSSRFQATNFEVQAAPPRSPYDSTYVDIPNQLYEPGQN